MLLYVFTGSWKQPHECVERLLINMGQASLKVCVSAAMDPEMGLKSPKKTTKNGCLEGFAWNPFKCLFPCCRSCLWSGYLYIDENVLSYFLKLQLNLVWPFCVWSSFVKIYQTNCWFWFFKKVLRFWKG